MSSENASSDMVQKKIHLVLNNGKVEIEGEEGFSIDPKSPVLKVSELYKVVFADITEPTLITVTAAAEVKNGKETKPIFQSVKTIVDNAIEEINLGFAAFEETEDDVGEPSEDEEAEADQPVTYSGNIPDGLFFDSSDEDEDEF